MHIISVNLKKDIFQSEFFLIAHFSHGNVGRGGGKRITDELEKIRRALYAKMALYLPEVEKYPSCLKVCTMD